jgi:leucyl-tRNA synthetase
MKPRFFYLYEGGVMEFKSIEQKWQQKWEEEKLNNFDHSKRDKKLYCLEMFSYPSGAKLHLGHWYNYGPTDSWARFKKMQGYEVFQPMGFDAFGLPAENYAIKTGIHPKDSTMKNIATMEGQLKSIGAMFDWEHEVITCNPDYYKWTQWLFLKLYDHGLAYRKAAPVNWCPSCNTVLANEQVVDGECERCGSEVVRKNLTQWFFKITDYAEELLSGLDTIDWPHKTKMMQKNWIGKSVGAKINFEVVGKDINFDVFTTRPDTLYGVTYVVLAPESELVNELIAEDRKEAIEEYIKEASKISEIDRQSTVREKTGVFTGSYAINPVNGEKVEIWIGDYVLASYGTGCVMAVPGHDERDFEFATKYNLEIKRVVNDKDGNEVELPFVEYGKSVNSDEFSGMTTEEAKEAIVKKLESNSKGNFETNYRLRDWLVSRQRYWGAPIPMIYCDKCGVVKVPEENLPVELPYDVDFTPDGKSPLAKCDEFKNTTCPVCGGAAEREVDTLDTFVCSSWYQMRYPDANNSEEAFNKEIINQMLPVDKYVGGAEHACMHLLYARFITKALRDMGYLSFDEPFKSLVHQGLILGPDGNKMSKSKGNTVSPDEYVEEFGSDTFRMYLMFGFNFVEGGAWDDNGIKAISRFIDRLEKNVESYIETKQSININEKADQELEVMLNKTIKSITIDTEKFQFNTSIARMMELTNAINKYFADGDVNKELLDSVISKYVRLLAPFGPHIAEELWEKLGNEQSIFRAEWPEFDENKMVLDTVEIPVQVNGKVRAKIEMPKDAEKDEVLSAARAAIEDKLDGKSIVKEIYVPGRILNIVVK